MKWHQITIVDPNALPGKSIFDVIQHLLKLINFKFVVNNDIVGAGISFFKENENKVMDINTFLSNLFEVVQFDWGDFFLFKDYPENWINSKKDSYPFQISKTDTTVRAIDDTYIYVYTPYHDVVNVLKENYEIEIVKYDLLEKLDYPY